MILLLLHNTHVLKRKYSERKKEDPKRKPFFRALNKFSLNLVRKLIQWSLMDNMSGGLPISQDFILVKIYAPSIERMPENEKKGSKVAT